MKDSDKVSVKVDQRRLRVEEDVDRRDAVGFDQRLYDLVVEVEHKKQKQCRERNDCGERRLRFGFLDARSGHAAVTDHHGDCRTGKLKRQNVDAGDQADQSADHHLGDDHRQKHARLLADKRNDLVPHMDQQRAGRRDRDEKPDLYRHADTGNARHQQKAPADAAEGNERRKHHAFGDCRHEILPRTRISTPLAISTWLRTGSVVNSRSMIMRT